MSNAAIRVESLGKQYRIGAPQQRNQTLRDAIVSELKTLASKRVSQAADRTIWALKDVSFEVKSGEVVGVIGRNGAGKSTLLKLLSHITEPTEGRVTLSGRVGSLLEVGTGFHAELTGRENIYLNGAILGMQKAEVGRRFDEIVAFAETEKFLDTPVKRYSSGMYVRLAFAVAAHLEPEILLVDEVLAVGDAEFQKKCLGQMDKVAKQGRTVMFVSHNMGAIESLCSRALLVEKGKLISDGESRNIVARYMAGAHQQADTPFADCLRTGNGKLRITAMRLENTDGLPTPVAHSGSPIVFAFDFENFGCSEEDEISCSLSVHNDREWGLFHSYSHFSKQVFSHLPARGAFKWVWNEVNLSPGNYLVMCRVMMNGDHVMGEEVDFPRVFVPFSVLAGDFFGTGNINLSTWGPILVKGNWLVTEST